MLRIQQKALFKKLNRKRFEFLKACHPKGNPDIAKLVSKDIARLICLQYITLERQQIASQRYATWDTKNYKRHIGQVFADTEKVKTINGARFYDLYTFDRALRKKRIRVKTGDCLVKRVFSPYSRDNQKEDTGTLLFFYNENFSEMIRHIENTLVAQIGRINGNQFQGEVSYGPLSIDSQEAKIKFDPDCFVFLPDNSRITFKQAIEQNVLKPDSVVRLLLNLETFYSMNRRRCGIKWRIKQILIVSQPTEGCEIVNDEDNGFT